MISFSAALMVGGRSQRMGQDKALLTWRGRPLIDVQLEKLWSLRPERLFLSGRAEQSYRPSVPQVEFISDENHDGGPLAGLVSCLRAAESQGDDHLVLILGIDLPRVGTDFLADLLYEVSPGQGLVVEHESRYEPLAAIYPVRLRRTAELHLRAGRYALHELIRAGREEGLMRVQRLRDAEPDLFLNLNTPEDVIRARS
jgi:molybdenum cofactor guanylyltransferase